MSGGSNHFVAVPRSGLKKTVLAIDRSFRASVCEITVCASGQCGLESCVVRAILVPHAVNWQPLCSISSSCINVTREYTQNAMDVTRDAVFA